MTINMNKNGTLLEVAVEGRLDTTTAPELQDKIKEGIEGITELTVDFSKVEYISSAGLRVLLSTQKIMSEQGKMIVKNVNQNVMEVFEITGFTNLLTIVNA